MDKYYLAIDIGASSGRHMLASLKNGKIVLEEVYRFKNGFEKKNGRLCWDANRLFCEIKNGLKKCKELGKIPVSMGIDNWGVDFVLLDENNNALGDCVSYRDSRTAGMDKEAEKIISEQDLYARTGIQKQTFNTIYQLMALKVQNPEIMAKADSFLMLAPYFNFLLTGVKKLEYTNATTTGLINAETKTWDRDLIRSLGLKDNIFGEVYMPSASVGDFLPEIQKEIGFNCNVVLPATHDTASAVLAVPAENEDNIYISSGTWSLMGIERETADCSEQSRILGLTNEGGVNYRFRALQNIMGLWIIQSIKKNLDDKYSFGELSDMARSESAFPSEFDVNDARFLAPENMTDEIKAYCRETNQKVPENIGELMQCVYVSLAKCYAHTVSSIEKLAKKHFSSVSIVGGGCQDRYLNELTAKATKKTVYAGPVEATALGNILVQLMADGVVGSVEEARALIRKSFDVEKINVW